MNSQSRILLLGEFIYYLYQQTFAILCSYIFIQIPNELSRETMTLMLQFMAVIKWLISVFCVINIFIIIKNRNNDLMTRRRNFEISPWNRGPNALIQIINIMFGIGYSIPFVPISSSNCSIFSYSEFACITMQILVIDTYLSFVIIFALEPVSKCILTESNSNRTHLFELPNFPNEPVQENETKVNEQYLIELAKKEFEIRNGSSNDEPCSICLQIVAENKENKWKRMPCTHEFHVECIDRWINEHNNCPKCRRSIIPTEDVIILNQ